MTDAAALLIIDCQRDFCPGGALAVTGGHEIMPLIHDLQSRFAHVILTSWLTTAVILESTRRKTRFYSNLLAALDLAV